LPAKFSHSIVGVALQTQVLAFPIVKCLDFKISSFLIGRNAYLVLLTLLELLTELVCIKIVLTEG